LIKSKTRNIRSRNSIWRLLLRCIVLLAMMFGAYWLYVKYRPACWFPKWNDYKVVGIDVSKYQSEVDWDEIQDQGIRFAFVKATQGRKMVDRNFKKNWDAIAGTKIARGAYHYYLPHIPWEEQAKIFVKTVALEKGDLPPVLDVEEVRSKQSEVMVKGMKKWLEYVEKYYGMKPVVYTYKSFYNDFLLNDFRGYNLWIAYYSNDQPEMLDDAHWEFWQYTEEGTLKGIKGTVDMNCFYGNEQDFIKILKK